MLGFEEYISETEIVLKEHREYEMLKNMKWYFIELPKFRNAKVDMDDKLNQWLAFIDDYKGERARMAEEKNEVIKKARVEMNYLTGEEAERRLQWLREKWEMDYNSDMGQARREGMKLGLEEGREKGLKEGSLNIIASRPRVGKTTLVSNIATFVSNQNIPVAIFSLEISKEMLLKNIIASIALVDINKLNTGKLNEDDLNKVKESKKSLEKKEIYIDDTPKMSIAEIREKSRKLKLEKNIGLIVIDYLQLIDTTSNDEQGRTEIMTNLKRLAKELNIPILVVSQLKSKVEQREDKKLYLTDLSKCIVQYADVIMFMNMDEEDDYVRKITIAKNTYGRIGEIELLFIAKWLKFANLEKWGDKFDKYWI